MILGLLFAAGIAYLAAAHTVERWPARRTVAWCAGLIVAAVALRAPHDFTAHMAAHLALGMAAPILLVLAAPVTLALNALPVRHARRLSQVLVTRPLRVLTHPVTALILNAGGLWLVYTTGLHHHPLVHVHFLASGYLFTAAIIGVDPAPHRPGRGVRAAVLIAYMASHAILAKHLYAHPPVPGAETGAQLMYYGGDAIDLFLIVVFCHQWYVATARDRFRMPV